MKNIWKKGMILGIIALFISVSTAPAFSAVPRTTQEDNTITVEYSSINADGSHQLNTLDITETEAVDLQNALSLLMKLIQSQNDKIDIFNLLQLFFNGNEYPILSKIIGNSINIEMLEKRNVILSQGFSNCLNPFKKTQTDMIRTFTFWRYQENSNLLTVPSQTTIVRFSPMEIETISGSQLGMMLRFKGIYINIPNKMPSQSFTFFVGLARHVGVFEMPNFELPEF